MLRRASLFVTLTATAAAAATLTLAVFAGFFFGALEEARERHAHLPRAAARLMVDAMRAEASLATARQLATETGARIRYRGPDGVFVNDATLPEFEQLRRLRRHRHRHNDEDEGRGAGEHHEWHGWRWRRWGRRLPPGFAFASAPDGGVYLQYEGEGRRAMVAMQSDFFGGKLALALALFAAGLAGVWGGAYWLIRRQLRPLAALTQGMEAVGDGKWQVFKAARDDELGLLARGLNNMQERLRALMQTRERFFLDASHELRSPITRLKLAAELLDAGDLQKQIAGDARELEALVEDILRRAKLESANAGLQRRRLNAGAWLQEWLAKHPQEQRRATTLQAAADVEVVADAALLARACNNLLNNALRYGDRASVCLRKDGGDALFVFADNGPGASEADLPKLFEPFFRADTSRARESGGFGLGLAIVASVAAAHGGTASAQNQSGGGLQIVLRLPLADSVGGVVFSSSRPPPFKV